MDLDKILIKLEKKGWKLEKDFLEINQEFLQDLVDETKEAINYTRCCTELKDKTGYNNIDDFDPSWIHYINGNKKTL